MTFIQSLRDARSIETASKSVPQGFTGGSSLAAGDVDLWLVDLDRKPELNDTLFKLLSSDEKNRANKYVFAKDRHQFVVGRAALRNILGGYLGILPELVSISARSFGKPYVTTKDSALRFNVSHSGGLALIAVSWDREVGVDVEHIDDTFDIFGVAPSVFSEAEVAWVRSLPIDLQASAFFSGWTRKEAFLKACGGGLSSSEELKAAMPAFGGEDSVEASIEDRLTVWSFREFQINGCIACTLVQEGPIGTVRFMRLIDHCNTSLAERNQNPQLGA